MDPDHESKLLALEKALYDESVDPIDLPFSLLKAITKNFSEGQQIGSGGFGEVYKGELQNGMVAVKKLFDFIVIDEKNFQSEVDSLLGVRHKNTVRFLGYCSDTQQVMDKFNGATVWAERRQRLLCFEFLPKGSLADYITDPSSGLQWETRYQIIKGICEGVHYLHQQRIIHMDLKPQNILLDGNVMPKIADFGLSRRLGEDQSQIITEHIVGSRGYWAPEFIGRGVITLKTDIYGLGVIFLEVLTGCKGSDKVEEVLESWMNVLETMPERHILLEQVKLCAEIGIQCMNDDPKNRPTTWDIILMLFDEEEISNWSARGVVSSPSMAQEMPLIAKLEYELKLMNLYGRPFLSKRVSALKRVEETSTETVRFGFMDSEILDVHPLELQFPFEAGKRTSCPLNLTIKAYQYVRFCIIPEFKDMYLCEENELVYPMSTCGVSITLVEQQQRPLKMIYVLMITSESESALENFMTSINWDDMMDKVDLPQRVEELGCQMHVAMVAGAVCPQSATTITPKVIFTKEFFSFNTMDVHPMEPWILVIDELHSRVSIWDYWTQKQHWVKKIVDDNVEVHAAKFIPRKQWFVTGEDYGNVHVYSCVTMKEIKKFSAYFTAHIKSLAVHPTYPLLITLAVWDNCEDPIRLWDWNMGWKCSQRISGGSACGLYYTPFRFKFKFNPKDTTTFAAAHNGISHVWSIHSSEPLITIMSPNCHRDVCDYLYTDSHPQYVITSAQYGGLKVWDLQTETCVHTLSLCGKSIGPVVCHPELPLIVAGSPSGFVSFWNSANYRGHGGREDHGNVRVYSCVTMTEIKKFRAYFSACINSLAVHPTYPLLITLAAVWDNCEDPIRLWDWEMGWKCSQRISGGSACGPDTRFTRLRFKFNPKDTTTFAAAHNGISQVWSIHSSKPLITIRPTNCDGDVCDYLYTDSHPQYLITSGQYGGLKVWDLQTETCVHALSLCGKSIGPVVCHPELPLIVAAGSPGAVVCFWNSANYRLLKTFRWTHSQIVDFAFVGSRRLVIGYSEGIEVLDMDLEALSRQH